MNSSISNDFHASGIPLLWTPQTRSRSSAEQTSEQLPHGPRLLEDGAFGALGARGGRIAYHMVCSTHLDTDSQEWVYYVRRCNAFNFASVPEWRQRGMRDYDQSCWEETYHYHWSEAIELDTDRQEWYWASKKGQPDINLGILRALRGTDILQPDRHAGEQVTLFRKGADAALGRVQRVTVSLAHNARAPHGYPNGEGVKKHYDIVDGSGKVQRIDDKVFLRPGFSYDASLGWIASDRDIQTRAENARRRSGYYWGTPDESYQTYKGAKQTDVAIRFESDLTEDSN